jgi:hypothetical protein
MCDDVIVWINEQPNKNLYEMTLTMKGMMVPLEKAKNLATLEELPEGYYDEIIEGIPMYECKLLCDIHRVDIINRLLDENDNVITLKWKLRRLEKYYQLGMDEYNTSKKCSLCHNDCEKFMERENPKPYKKGKILVHGLLKCKTCQELWNRDENSSINIYILALNAIAKFDRPKYLSRT